jgi:uncharacterized membrane protein YfcA
VGVLAGALGGARILPGIQPRLLRLLFAAVVLVVAANMLAKAIR